MEPLPGYVSILSRSDDLINVSAHRLGTGLIEQVVTGHPDVVECAVVGAPDKLKGQSPFAVVVSRTSSATPGMGAKTSIHHDSAREMLRRINEHIRTEMGPIAQLGGLVETTKLPKTRSGKTLRRTIRAIVENSAEGRKDGEIPVPPTIEDREVVDIVKKAIEDYFQAGGTITNDAAAASNMPPSLPVSIKPRMKALQIERPQGELKKGQRNLAIVREVDTPIPKPGQVLVKMLASGFNRRDEWSMVGAYPGLTFTNSTMGCDGAGRIVHLPGASSSLDKRNTHPKGLVLLCPTRGWKSDPYGPEAELAGDRSTNEYGGRGFGILGGTASTGGTGTFAEYVAVDQSMVVPAPDHLDEIHSAALPCAAVTAYR
ncbi:acetyl-CoA synthetase-like protein [Violaceomyces palustris]|uniref:Acetyl-CoA synthetase-like protein n=1 Tax=Violaceomyces palustris TaxID=1673888 RepID=A0ACD0NL21_9BASI|nr:acetyl-CoA synthetase-like protein [Violaceomyces palustris]